MLAVGVVVGPPARAHRGGELGGMRGVAGGYRGRGRNVRALQVNENDDEHGVDALEREDVSSRGLKNVLRKTHQDVTCHVGPDRAGEGQAGCRVLEVTNVASVADHVLEL